MQCLDAPTSLFSLSQTSSDIWFVDSNPALSCTDIADCWLRKEYLAHLIISQLEQMVTQWDAILFQLVYGPDCLHTSLFIPTHQTAVGIVKARWSLLKEAYNFQYKLWENHDFTGQPVISCIYLCEQWYATYLSYFSNRYPVGPETELKCKIGIRENIPLVFYCIQTVGA
jgi:hypothetical protein